MQHISFAKLVYYAVLLISSKSFCQNPDQRKTDSLLQVVNKTIPDSAGVDALNALATGYTDRGKYDSAKYYGLKAIALGKKINYKSGEGKAYTCTGLPFVATQQYDSAKYYLNKSLEILLPIRDTLGIAAAYIDLGALYNFISENKMAIEYFFRALSYVKDARDAISRRQVVAIYANLGLCFIEDKQFQKAIEYQKQALAVTDYRDENAVHVKISFSIAEAFINLQNYQQARLYLDTAISKFPILHNLDVESHVLKTEARYYECVNQPEKALLTYKSIFQLIDSTHNEKLHAEVADNIARLYLKIKNYNQAQKFAGIAISIGTQVRFLRVVSEGYNTLQKISEEKGNYKEALQYANLYKLYSDSVTNGETQKTSLTLEAKYQGKKRENEIAILTLSNIEKQLALVKRNRILVTGSVIASALLLIIALLYRSTRQKQMIAEKEQKLQHEQIKFLEKQQQIVSLHSMVNGQETERTRIARDLHDGLGGLFSTIKMYFSTLQHQQEILKNNELFDKSYELIDNASEEVRRIAHNMMPEVLMKLGLIPALQDMCSNINAGKLMQVKLQSYGMDKRMNASTEIMLYRIIQELLNNIIKHAKATEALVQFNKNEKSLTVTVEDNGRGFNLLELDNKTHAGLETIRSRVTYLNGNISINTQEAVGTTVMMEFIINNEA